MKHKHIWFGLFCGCAVSIIENLTFALFTFYEMWVSFSPALLCCVLAIILLKTDNGKAYVVSILFVIVGYIAVELMVISVGIPLRLYRITYNDASEIPLGNGVIQAMSLIIHWASLAIGFLIAGILTVIEKRKLRKA